MQDYNEIKEMLDDLTSDENNVQIDVDISYSTGRQINLVREIMSNEHPDWTEVSSFYEQDTLVFRKDYDPDDEEVDEYDR